MRAGQRYYFTFVSCLSLISQDIVGADAPQFDLIISKTQGQAVPLADTDFKFIRSPQFYQSQGRMAKILKQQIL